jgi:hypothetical protein
VFPIRLVAEYRLHVVYRAVGHAVE